MSHPKSGQTCHADKTEQNHEGEKALHTKELQNYNHDNDSKQEENPMALRADLLNADLRLVEGQERPATSDYEKIFEKAAERAINLMTLDERIESFRRWPFAGEQQDFKDLLKMQYERDTEDYSNPGTWYGVIRKWQAMTEEEALAAFRTDWREWGTREYSQEDLKAFYRFIKERPLSPLTESEKVELYDRRHDPACLKPLLEEMEKTELMHIFESTYDCTHSAVWTVCKDDIDAIREAVKEIRPDALESLVFALSDAASHPAKSNIIPFRTTHKSSEPKVIERFYSTRRGFVTLSWGTDYDLLMALKKMSEEELKDLYHFKGFIPDEHLITMQQKIKACALPKPALPNEPEDGGILALPEITALYGTFSEEEDKHFSRIIDIFCDLPERVESAPIHNLEKLQQCLKWVCEEDLLQLKAAIDGKLAENSVTAIKPPPSSKLVSELWNLLKDATPEQVELFENELKMARNILETEEPLNIRIAKAISHPKHYQRRYDHLKNLGQENTEYGVWLRNLVNEYCHQDCSQPATEWGVIQRMETLTLEQFATELEQLQDRWGASLALKRKDSDIDGLHQAVLDAAFTDEQREEFYLESGLNGHVKEFISNLTDSMECLFEDYRDAIAPDWADLSHPAAAGDDGLTSVISELLELPMDLLMLLSQELPKHQRSNAKLLPSEKQINSELLEELRAMDPEERAQTMAYIKQMED